MIRISSKHMCLGGLVSAMSNVVECKGLVRTTSLTKCSASANVFHFAEKTQQFVPKLYVNFLLILKRSDKITKKNFD